MKRLSILKEICSRPILPSTISALKLKRIGSYQEDLSYIEDMREEYPIRRRIEEKLVSNHWFFRVPGFCYVCRSNRNFWITFRYAYSADGEKIPNWREQLICPYCRLSNRRRAAIHIFEQECEPQPGSMIYISEQRTSLYRMLSERYRNLQGSEYAGREVPLGSVNRKGIRNEDITELTFGSNHFDYIMCFDVLEHVPDYMKGFSESLRCLKPGGRLVFNVPFTRNPDTLVRAQIRPDGTTQHFLPPEYHGSRRWLCFYHFGWDLLSRLRQIGFKDVKALFYWSRDFGYLGNNDQVIFIAGKPL